jgi:two-component system OmpR family sensor kinase
MKFLLRTFRARLTLWHLVVMGTILLAAGFLLYVGMVRALQRNLDSSLWAIAETEAASLFSPAGPFVSILPERPDEERAADRVDRHIQVLDRFGNIIAPAPNLGVETLPVDAESLRGARMGQVVIETATLPSGHVRVLYLPIEGPEGVSQILQVGLSMRTLESTLKELFRLIALVEGCALLLIGVGGFFLTKKSLRPVDEIARAAAFISERNLSRRLPEEAGADELAHLVRVLNRMLGRLEQAFTTQERFTADASHELRTPLAIMKGTLEVALKKERSPMEYREVLGSVREEVERLSRLVTALLTLARVDTAMLPERRSVKLLPLLGEVVDLLRTKSAGREVTLDLEGSNDLTVFGTEDALKQLFLNLLDNAVQYTKPGGRAWVKTLARANEVIIEVGDTGVGIEEEDQERIFDRFYRGATARGSDIPGSGLGLAISAQIVKDLDGRIEVVSSTKPPTGTQVSIFLPRASG